MLILWACFVILFAFCLYSFEQDAWSHCHLRTVLVLGPRSSRTTVTSKMCVEGLSLYVYRDIYISKMCMEGHQHVLLCVYSEEQEAYRGTS